jgi:hypothetical protein
MPSADGPGKVAVLCAVTGMRGVGKTPGRGGVGAVSDPSRMAGRLGER